MRGAAGSTSALLVCFSVSNRFNTFLVFFLLIRPSFRAQFPVRDEYATVTNTILAKIIFNFFLYFLFSGEFNSNWHSAGLNKDFTTYEYFSSKYVFTFDSDWGDYDVNPF